MTKHPNQPKARFTSVDHLWTTRLQQLAIAQQLTFENSTGMRRGEILNLKWNDVDLDRGAILLQTTKNGERRFVPLIGIALGLLKSRHANQSTNSLVFPATHSPSKPIDIRSAWKTAVAKAGISNFRFHDLRHTAASYLAMNQATLLEIGTLLGHKTVQVNPGLKAWDFAWLAGASYPRQSEF